MRALRRYLRPGILRALPTNMVPDPSADYGLIALMANANVYSQRHIDLATAGTNSTLTATQALCGLLRLTAGASGGFTITLPSTVVLLAALGVCIPTDGTFTKLLTILNDNIGQTGTLTPGDASTTVTGTATIATNVARRFALTVASGGTTIAIQNFGSNAI